MFILQCGQPDVAVTSFSRYDTSQSIQEGTPRMIEGYDIIIYTFADWRATWSTPQQIAARLAPANRVLYVDVPRSMFYSLRPKDPQGAGEWPGERLQEVQRNLWVYHPPHVFTPVGFLPYGLARQGLRINGRLLVALVRRQLDRLHLDQPILWNFSPLHGKAVGGLPHRFTIHDVCDEWANYVRRTSGKRLLRWIDEELCRQADLVFTGTESARQLRIALNPETHVVHHAADYEHFAKAVLSETRVPEVLARLPKPVIGSVGVIDPARFDVDLIVHLSRERPDWSIVLIGPARADMDLSPLRALRNVHLLGHRPIAELPSYLKGIDVALIPYKVNEATRDIYPLKLHEYLAAGRPVVCSAMPALMPYAGVVAVAASHGAFVRFVEDALQNTDARQVAVRQAVARANSWEQRIEEKSAHIQRLLAIGPGSRTV